MLEPIYLTTDNWYSLWGKTYFKVLKEPESIVVFQTSLIVWRGEVPELDCISQNPSFGFYFSITKDRQYFGACLGDVFYQQSSKDPAGFLKSVKKSFPEYGNFLESNYKENFKQLF